MWWRFSCTIMNILCPIILFCWRKYGFFYVLVDSWQSCCSWCEPVLCQLAVAIQVELAVTLYSNSLWYSCSRAELATTDTPLPICYCRALLSTVSPGSRCSQLNALKTYQILASTQGTHHKYLVFFAHALHIRTPTTPTICPWATESSWSRVSGQRWLCCLVQVLVACAAPSWECASFIWVVRHACVLIRLSGRLHHEYNTYTCGHLSSSRRLYCTADIRCGSWRRYARGFFNMILPMSR